MSDGQPAHLYFAAGLERPAVRRVGPVTHAFPVPVALDPLVSSWSADPVLAAQSADTLFSHDRTCHKFFSFFVHSFSLPGHTSTSFFYVLHAVIVLETVNHLPEQTVNNHTSLYSPHPPAALRAGLVGTNVPLWSSNLRDDVGIVPYASRGLPVCREALEKEKRYYERI